ncbi:putative manganese-dependent inorganic diphosphatase [Dubosiella muris]|uniref:Manganese-dependent inorganic diphosphatase n=1 Tax=Dubosiella muris TaxID=3038133 RepID=A0AC61R972_9FIRM|nr:putative manganese-dependent inorganic diphosphatase [Dubosiella muris]TGY66468.1 putative manganese-dependent inorganic diphosphatase [Dubosiella muris]
MNTIYITGHRHPDSDSIVAAISYAYLKNQNQIPAVACRLGPLNDETAYLLNRFHFDEPPLLEDARVRLYDLPLERPYVVEQDATIFETLEKMRRCHQPFMAVVDSEQKVVGMITTNDLGVIALADTALGIDLLKDVKTKDVAKTLDGNLVFDDEQLHLNGKVSIVTLSRHKADRYQVKDRIVIIGDDTASQKQVLEQGAGMLIIVWSGHVDEEVLELAAQKHCPIIISGHGSMNTSRYLFFAPTIQKLMSGSVHMFHIDEFMEDAAKKMRKDRFRAYPVVNDQHRLVGYLLKDAGIDYENKSMILVDHNEFSQSVPNIEKATILEVVDHHRINDFSTTRPIYFRNEIIGSTTSIIASMFFESGIEPPKALAGLMLGAIISDTMNFQSPTTTAKDIELAERLSQIAAVKTDDLAYDMYFMASNCSQKSASRFLEEDVKAFTIESRNVLIAQAVIPSIEDIACTAQQIEEALEEQALRKGADLFVMVFTDILQKGSYFYFGGPLKSVLETTEQTPLFMEHVLSRKNQILPWITNRLKDAL